MFASCLYGAGLFNFMPLECITCLLCYCAIVGFRFVWVVVLIVGGAISCRGLVCFRCLIAWLWLLLLVSGAYV